MVIVAAIAKYNPCVVHATRGVLCPFFDQPRAHCGVPLGSCNMAEYDGWSKDALSGLTKCFYPSRIRALEIPGTFLLLYHTHKRAIVGEAKIIRVTSEDDRYYYWFDSFLLYPTPVDLKLVQTDSRLFRFSKFGRWTKVYISDITLKEIRDLSRIHGRIKKKVTLETEFVKQEVKRRGQLNRESFSLVNEWKILSESGVKDVVLRKTEEFFLHTVRNRLMHGRSQKTIYYALLYLAHKSIDIPVKPSQIRKIGNIKGTKRFYSAVNVLSQKLGLSMGLFSPKEWVTYYSNKLGMSTEAIRRAIQYVETFKTRKYLKHRSPSSISASAVYLACRDTNQNVPLRSVADVFSVSDVTIRNILKSYQLSTRFENAKTSFQTASSQPQTDSQ